MANSSLDLTSLDFNTLKDNFKQYLKSQTVFKDYNFDGSNMNVLLDVMSYNSYLNSFYLNMVASEMFLDSAQKLDSVVSHAKELNYLPKSAKSPAAVISFTANTVGVSNPFTIPKGTLFSGTNANGTFTFSTDQAYTYTSSNSTYSVTDLTIFEGTYVQDAFVHDSSIANQRFLLTNPTIDIDSLTVTVSENNGQNIVVYSRVETLYNLTNESEIYFVQAAQNNQYEIVFGDGILGKVPQNGAVIVCEYRITLGNAGDGVNNFTCIQDLGPINGGQVRIPSITVTTAAVDGAVAETIESIRKSAPRYFATQQRAVSSDDYSSLINAKFGNLINDVNVYGGETQSPPLYGRVIIAVKPANGLVAPNYLKDEIKTYLSKFIGLPTRAIITDPSYLYCGINATVQYNSKATTKTANDIKNLVLNDMIGFSNQHLEKFGSDFRYSKFVSHIDNADSSITSNDTKIKIIKKLAPKLNYATSFDLEFNNPSETEESSPGYKPGPAFYDEPVLTSSSFTYLNDNGEEITYCYFRDDNYGKIIIYSVINNVFTIVKDNAGTIDYAIGKVAINAFTTTYYDTHINLYLAPQNKDIIADKNKIIIIDPTDVIINIIETVN
jgi:hypothetical protein